MFVGKLIRRSLHGVSGPDGGNSCMTRIYFLFRQRTGLFILDFINCDRNSTSKVFLICGNFHDFRFSSLYSIYISSFSFINNTAERTITPV